MGGDMKNHDDRRHGNRWISSNADAMQYNGYHDDSLRLYRHRSAMLNCLHHALKNVESLKTATFLLFITHLFWTLPDIVHFATGGSLHPPIPVMVLSLVGIGILFYASQKGEVASAN